MRVVFVHGACVRDGDWWWHRAAASLAGRGVQSVVPVLPSCGEATAAPGVHGPGLAEDVVSVRDALVDVDEPSIVVAHSYGGMVTAEAAAGLDHVRHIVLIASYLPEPGQSQASLGDGGAPPAFLDIDPEGGTFGVKPDLLVETFLQDCPPDVGEEAALHLARQSIAVLQTPVQASAWQQTPTTYLVCTEDRGTPAAAQRAFAKAASQVHELPAGHHPFLSQPDAVADLITALG